MSDEQLEKLKYPIGKLQIPELITPEIIEEYIDTIDSFQDRLIELDQVLTPEILETPYRPDGWTVRQVLNHLADSHMTAFLRFKMALTEDNPTVKGYKQDLFVKTPEVEDADHFASMMIISGVHQRWTSLLQSLNETDFERTYYHEEYGRTYILKNVLALYAWHTEHHFAHIKNVLLKFNITEDDLNNIKI